MGSTLKRKYIRNRAHSHFLGEKMLFKIVVVSM